MSYQVQETNDFSIASKYSMVHNGYFKDELMQFMSPKLKRRSPLINIGYYVRAVVVNEGIQLFLNILPDVECQIVSLGAGFDTTFFRIVHKHRNINYYEIDFKEVVDRKINYIKSSTIIFNQLISPQENSLGLTSKNYSIISQDMSHILELQSVLTSFGFDMEKPTLFFSECAITYMAEDSSTEVINWASRLENVLFMVYEQINPDDGFGQVMVNHFRIIDSPLKSVEKYKTKEDQIYRYNSCGFPKGFSVGAFELYRKMLSEEEYKRILNLEPFDEWEEWHLTSSHYTLSAGAKGLFEKPVSDFFSEFSSHLDVSLYDFPFSWDIMESTELKVYAHSALLIWNSDSLLVVGGFGLANDSKHKRLDQLLLLNLRTMEVVKLTPPKIEGITWDCLYHTCSLLSDSENETRFLLYGGRTSPVNNVNSPGFVITIRREELDHVHISGRKVKQIGICPEARRRHCSVPFSGRVFMCGGLSARKHLPLKVFGDAWLFTNEEQWIQLDSEIPARFSHSAVYHNDMVFIIGGLGEEFEPLSDVWSFSMTESIWTRYNLKILPRYSHTAHFYDGFIILVGGVNYLSEIQPGICVITIESKAVIEYKLPRSMEMSSVMLHNHSSIFSSNMNSICIIGGGGNCFSFGTSFNKSITSFKLDQLATNSQQISF